jgi:hypothetical protein
MNPTKDKTTKELADLEGFVFVKPKKELALSK